MRNAVIAACAILTITALCDNAMARGGAGMRARPSTPNPHRETTILAIPHEDRATRIWARWSVGGTSRTMAGVERDKHTPHCATQHRASSSLPRRLTSLRMNPEGISGPGRSEAETGARALRRRRW